MSLSFLSEFNQYVMMNAFWNFSAPLRKYASVAMAHLCVQLFDSPAESVLPSIQSVVGI
jgi:hypothetical protein